MGSGPGEDAGDLGAPVRADEGGEGAADGVFGWPQDASELALLGFLVVVSEVLFRCPVGCDLRGVLGWC